MKRFLKIVAIGIPLGIILVIIENVMNLDHEMVFRYYWICGSIFILAVLFINLIYQFSFIKKVKKVTSSITSEEKNFDLFFEETEKMLTKYKSSYNRGLLLINLSYAYGLKKDYQKGLETLKSIEVKKVKGINKIIYSLNLSCFNFYLGNYEEVIKITDKFNKEFQKFKENPILGWNIASNKIYYYIAKGEFQEAKKFLEEAKSNWIEKQEMKEEWEMLAQILYKEG